MLRDLAHYRTAVPTNFSRPWMLISYRLIKRQVLVLPNATLYVMFYYIGSRSAFLRPHTCNITAHSHSCAQCTPYLSSRLLTPAKAYGYR